MEKETRIKTLSLVALIVAVLGLTVAFASLSQTLTINGTASVDAATWDIHFANLSEAVVTGDAYVTTDPTIEAGSDGKANTVIGDYELVLTKPGDSISYTFDVTNAGTIDASLSKLTKALTPTCSSNASVDEDATIVCDGLTYTLTYTDGGQTVSQGDALNKGETKNMTLKLAYDSDKLPSDDVTISDLGITLNYVQK